MNTDAHTIENINTDFKLPPELKRLEKTNNPWKIFREMTSLGLSSGIKSVRNIALLAIINLIFFFIGAYLFFQENFSFIKLLLLLLIIGVGTLFVFIGIKKVFDLLKIEYSSYLFNQFDPYIHKIFEDIFQKTENTTEKIVSKKQIKNAFGHYLPKIPKAFHSPLLFLLSFVPIVGFIADIYATPTLNSHQKQSDALYEKIQRYLQQIVEEERRGYWLIWALLINVFLQGLLLYWLR